MSSERNDRSASPQVRAYYADRRRIERVQGLRRSNAAQPRPGKRKGDIALPEDYVSHWCVVHRHRKCGLLELACDCHCHDPRACEICGTQTEIHTDELCFK